MNTLDLEVFREALKDTRLHLAIAQVKKLMYASDRSVLRVLVSVLPEEREIIARMSWPALGSGGGLGQEPSPNDLVIIGAAEGSEDIPFILTTLSNREDTIPAQIKNGHLVAKAKPGKELWLTSETKILLSKGDTAPTEPLVLGNVLNTFLTEFLDSILNAASIGECAVGPVVLSPGLRTAFTNQKSTYLTTASTNIVSQLAFTERGGE